MEVVVEMNQISKSFKEKKLSTISVSVFKKVPL